MKMRVAMLAIVCALVAGPVMAEEVPEKGGILAGIAGLVSKIVSPLASLADGRLQVFRIRVGKFDAAVIDLDMRDVEMRKADKGK